MTNYHRKVSDILIDDDFINYVFDPTPDLLEKWESIFRIHPDMLALAEKARLLLTDFQENTLTSKEISNMEQNILSACGLKNAN